MTTIHHGQGMAGLGGHDAPTNDRTQSGQSPGSQLQAQAQSQPGSSSAPGKVQITPTAQLLANVAQQLADTPDIDHKRVDSIRQALASGSYQVDAGRIADGLLTAQKVDDQLAAGAASQSSSAKVFAATAQLGSDAI